MRSCAPRGISGDPLENIAPPGSCPAAAARGADRLDGAAECCRALATYPPGSVDPTRTSGSENAMHTNSGCVTQTIRFGLQSAAPCTSFAPASADDVPALRGAEPIELSPSTVCWPREQ